MIRQEKKGNYTYDNLLKRLIDISASCVGHSRCLPLFIILPIVIKIESKGPVFYKRGVIGKNGIPFFAYKFRTMVQDADEILENNPELNRCFLECFKIKRDPRITKMGYYLRKYSFDEIPQLINVLKGQMSIVGPRMMTTLELREYGEYRDLILSVKPGLTGLWQVSGRQNVTFKRRVELDILYVNSWSLYKDLAIIFKTFRVIFNGEGAY